jgi:SAM-dependent methyltransferase
VELNLSQRDDDNLYARLLARLKAGETFLDVGCCLGQDIRKLVFDGAPPQNVMGAELNPGFIDQGYALFRDHEKLAGRFVAPADILGDEGGAVAKLHGTFDVVQLGMILHLFTWEEQKTVFINAIDLLKKDKKGSLVIGQAVGDLAGLSRKTAGGGEKATYMHNGESFSKLIKEVGEATGTEWKVRAFLDPHIGMQKDRLAWNDAATRMLSFEIERA